MLLEMRSIKVEALQMQIVGMVVVVVVVVDSYRISSSP